MARRTTFHHDDLTAISDALRALRITKDEQGTLSLIETVISNERIEAVVDYFAGGGFSPSHAGRMHDLRRDLKTLTRERKRLIEEELPDADSWTDDFHDILTLVNRILITADPAFAYLTANGIAVDDLVTDAELERVRAEIRGAQANGGVA